MSDLLANQPELDRNSTVSLHDQLHSRIKSLIISKELGTGAKLPSEAELGRRFGISRMTVRLALAQLEQEGYVTKRGGKGTYVAAPKIPDSVSILAGFSEKMEAQGHMVETTVVSALVTTPAQGVRVALGLAEGEEVFEIRRVRYVDGEPIVHQTVILPKALYPGILEADLTGSLTRLLETRFDLRLTRCEEVLTPIMAGSEEVTNLGVKRNTPLLMIEGISFNETDSPVRYTRGIYRSDRLQFTVHSADSFSIDARPTHGSSAGLMEAFNQVI